MVYPGVGWVIWRTKEDLPEELVFKVAYLGEEQVRTCRAEIGSRFGCSGRFARCTFPRVAPDATESGAKLVSALPLSKVLISQQVLLTIAEAHWGLSFCSPPST